LGIFDDKVVVITGAGGGIGRSHALAFAREGAKVVVNDLGSTPDGSGSTVSMADKVVDEIRSSAGTAVANYDSVSTINGGNNIVKTAVDNFGKIDILINNAGILRDKTIIKMEDQDWDAVLAVHLKGTFACTRAAARVMKEQGTGGRIINTSSVAGLLGNFGQCNYGSAKAGIYGFTKVAALEFKRFGVTVNCIAPMAKTRLTAEIDAVPEEMTPEQVTPLVLFLARDKAADITGRIFGIHGQHLFEYQMKTSPGVEKEGKELWTLKEIEEKFAAITEFPTGEKVQEEEPSEGPSIDDLFKKMPEVFRAGKAPGWSTKLHFSLTGADDWVVIVENDAVTVSKTIPDQTSCVITMSAETMMGLITGKVDPTKAFMAGNIKASNLPELMKFNKAFSFSKLKALLEEGSTSESTSPSLSEVFKQMPRVFKSDKAGDWVSTIHFDITGDENQTLKVENQKCEVKTGFVGKPDCIITVKKEALEGLINGTVDPTKAFMAGDIKASSLPVLMKFNKLFSLKDLSKAIKKTPAKQVEVETDTGLDPAIVGRFYTGEAEFVKPERVRAYAKATNETNPRYYVENESELAVPPIYPVTTLIAPMRDKILVDDTLNLDIMRMVHAEHEIVYYRSLKPWDLVYTTVELESIDRKYSGDILWAKISGLVEGKPVYDMHAGFFFKKAKREQKPEGSEKAVEKEVDRKIILSKQMVVTQDQAIRYAEASGDNNPVHLDKEMAQAAGLPDVFLQGLCTMAFATQAIVDDIAGGDPEKVVRVKTRFSKPVFMQDTLTTEAWLKEEKNGTKIIGFETKNQDNIAVLTRGEVKLKK